MKINEVVVYHNDFNRVVLRTFTAEEMNIFISLLVKLRDLGTKQVELSPDEIRQLVQYNPQNKARFINTLESAINKIAGITYYEKSEKRLRVMAVFKALDLDLENYVINAEVSDYWEYIINSLNKGNLTIYELEEFVRLRSTYSKTVYRLLKQNKNWTEYGKYDYAFREFSVDEFKILLDIPKSYNASSIKRAVIDQVEKELSPLFENFKIKIVKSNTRGTPVTGYRFMFKPQKPSNQKWVNGKYNKKSNAKSLAEKDNRMSESEREEYVNKKLKQKIPIKRNPEYDKDLKILETGQLEI